MTLETYVKVAKACIISGSLWALTVYSLNYPIPRSSSIIYILLSTVFIFVTRFSARTLLIPRLLGQRKNILIYGDIQTSSRLAELLKNNLNTNPIGIITGTNEFKKTQELENCQFYLTKKYQE